MWSAPVGNIWQPRENNNNLRSSFVSRIRPCKIAGPQNHYLMIQGASRFHPAKSCKISPFFSVFLELSRVSLGPLVPSLGPKWRHHVSAVPQAHVGLPAPNWKSSTNSIRDVEAQKVVKSLWSLQKGQAIWPTNFFCMLRWLRYTTSPWAGHVQLT